MPDQISVSEFIAETTEDYNSPTTSSFTTRLHNCRNTVTLLEEVGRGRRAPREPAEPPLAAAARLAWHPIAWIPEPGTFGAAGPHPLRDPRSRVQGGPGVCSLRLPPMPGVLSPGGWRGAEG